MSPHAVAPLDHEAGGPEDLLGVERHVERPASPLEKLEVVTLELVGLDRLAS